MSPFVYVAWTAAILLTTTVAPAAVSERFVGGFALSYAAQIPVDGHTALREFGRIQRWWDPAHSYSGKSRALRLDLRPGGCFCEAQRNLFVRHLDVVRIEAGKRVVLSGALGPLQTLAVHAVLTVEVQAAEDDSHAVRWSYRVAGDDPEKLKTWADGVDQVMESQFQRFVQHLRDL